ncbi:NucA/NucB deoxyribonuclease domain-containing protein [Streptomyces sp. IBSNAI002]|uniref:NucA/NucB deoxyribonuclease domain-containing protein n=1 Tax=Streptomyces sp. IBSNAI002 TaxID=3457500 RepID=UPI003FD1A528
MKHVIRLRAAMASLALTAVLLAPDVSPATAAPLSAAPDVRGACTATTPGSTLARQGAARTCVKDRAVTAEDLARIRARTAAVPGGAAVPVGTAATRDDVDPGDDPAAGPEALCTSKKRQDVVANRHAYCMRHAIVYLLENRAGDTIGTAELLVTARSAVDPKSVTWQENIAVFAGKYDGVSAMRLALSSSCTACIPGPPAWGGGAIELRAGEEDQSGHLFYETTTRGGGERSRSMIAYQSQTESPDAEYPVIGYGQWAGPSVACDGQVGSTPGCIATDSLATVVLSKSQYGASAVAYEWAQNNLSNNNAMGTAKRPLTRDSDKPRAKSRSYYTCKAPPKPFVADLTVVNDECDEFPFARTRQGGTLGSLCAEIIPRYVGGGVWRVDVVRDEPAAPCIRAHVSSDVNQNAGRSVGRQVQTERILQGEAYQVLITP